jgi:histone deacetylase 11
MPIHPHLVYSRHYNIRACGLERLHPFDSCKYGRAFVNLRSRGVRFTRTNWLRPKRANFGDLRWVHSLEYLARLKDSAYLARVLEIPQVAKLPNWFVRNRILRPMLYATGGTVLAAREALRCKIAINLGGGYHHASRDRGEGFCVYSDVAIALARLRAEGALRKALIIDLDAHQGNGLERIYGGDPDTGILDMYNREIYPMDFAARDCIDWDLPLRPGTADKEYLGLLGEALPRALDEFHPDLAIYNAGTDIYQGDPLGGLAVSETGVFERDRLVFDMLTERSIPWVMVTSGGYTRESYRLIANSVAFVFQKYGNASP